MGIIIDVLIVIIFILFVSFSAKRGFMLSLLQLVSSFLAIFCAIKLSEILAPYAYQYLFENKLVESITNTISGMEASAPITQQASVVVSGLPKLVLGFASFLGISTSELSKNLIPSDTTATAIAQEIADKVVSPIIIKLCASVLIVVLFIILIIIFNVFAKLINKLFKKLPIIKGANKILGALLGAIKSLVFIALLSAIIYVVANITMESSERFFQVVSESRLLTIINSYNPLLTFLLG